MGWWSKIKHAVKAVVRAVVRAVVVVVVTSPTKVFDFIFGWLGWPRRNCVCISRFCEVRLARS